MKEIIGLLLALMGFGIVNGAPHIGWSAIGFMVFFAGFTLACYGKETNER